MCMIALQFWLLDRNKIQENSLANAIKLKRRIDYSFAVLTTAGAIFTNENSSIEEGSSRNSFSHVDGSSFFGRVVWRVFASRTGKVGPGSPFFKDYREDRSVSIFPIGPPGHLTSRETPKRRCRNGFTISPILAMLGRVILFTRAAADNAGLTSTIAPISFQNQVLARNCATYTQPAPLIRPIQTS
jgi:hypothetical protein